MKIDSVLSLHENMNTSIHVRVAFLYALPMVQKILTTAGADGTSGMKSPHESRLKMIIYMELMKL